MPEPAAIRVLVIDDHPVVRTGLKVLLSEVAGVEVVGEAANGADAVAAASRTSPDVVLLDLDLAGDDGLRYVRQLHAVAPRSQILVLTGVRDRARHEAALEAGARGLVSKDRPSELLVAAIRRVHGGELWFDRTLVDAVLQRTILGREAPAPAAPEIATLTGREREIVSLIGEGLRNEEIGKRLSISEKTVRNHLSAVFEKLGVGDRLELVVYAFQHGLIRAPR